MEGEIDIVNTGCSSGRTPPSSLSSSSKCTRLTVPSAAVAMFCSACADGVHLRAGLVEEVGIGTTASIAPCNVRKSALTGATGHMFTGESARSRVECSRMNSFEGVATVAIISGK